MLLQDAGWNDTRISDALKQGDTRYVNIRQSYSGESLLSDGVCGCRTGGRSIVQIFTIMICTARSGAQIVPKAEQLIR